MDEKQLLRRHAITDTVSMVELADERVAILRGDVTAPSQLIALDPAAQAKLCRALVALNTDADDRADFDLLEEKIIDRTNPPDDDVAAVSIYMDAIDRLADFVADQPCCCPAETMGDEYGSADACPRCRALGRFANELVDR